MKAVIYARYSSDNQREESIEGQLRECKEYADKNGITILCSYIDRALSAKTDNRPEFQKMVQDSAKGLFDTVLVWKLDRFARNRYDSAHYKAVLRRNGVKVVSATENISDGPEGINAIQQGILTNSTKERLEELEKLREDLKASILQAELDRPKYSREDIIEWISRFKYGDPSNKEYQRQIIDIFLNSIYVFDDRLVFTYNYKNGTQTVSLADVSAAFGSDLKSCTPPYRMFS